MTPPLLRRLAAAAALLLAALGPAGCGAPAGDGAAPAAAAAAAPAEAPEAPSPTFRNVGNRTAYVGDATCATCHAREAAVYRQHSMASSFHRWTAEGRVERPLDSAITHAPSGLQYTVVEEAGRLFQVEFIPGPGGRRLHELRRRVDYVTGSGHVARTYFTEENGRLFQLPLTWYRDHGWDFSPGYESHTLRFERVLPDRCVACHASYPRTLPALEGKYAELRPGIGCERCHGPGALHARERRAGAPADPGGFDRSIVNPARLSVERRLDVCEQCHVHTDVAVPREGRGAFDYEPSLPLRDHFAFFRKTGNIDLVSHADRLRQSACFLAARPTGKPLECATCHDPHRPPATAAERNQPCAGCHASAALARTVAPAARAQHAAGADCAGCHMPLTKLHTLPHGAFTDHWIRVPGREPAAAPAATAAAASAAAASGAAPAVARYVEAYYARDRAGPEAALYQGMGAVVYAGLANSAPAMRAGAEAIDAALRAAPAAGGARRDAHRALGVAYGQLGRTADAARALEVAVRADSSDPETLRALAQAYLQAGRPVAAVLPLYERALARQPALASVRAEYAELLDADGLADRAVAEYRRAVAEQPSLAGAWLNLGTVLAGAGRLGDAAEALGRAVRLDPALGQALAPLVAVRTAGGRLTAVRDLGVPLPSLLVRDRGPYALRVTAGGDVAAPALVFVNAPERGLVRILRPDGSPVRTLTADGRGPVTWDLRTDGGRLAASGLYQALAQARDPAGRPTRPQTLLFAVARGHER